MGHSDIKVAINNKSAIQVTIKNLTQAGGPEVNTWYVNPSASGGNGSPQNPFTVNEAMAAAAADDVIFFQPGTYTTDITVSKNLTFVGYSIDRCIIDITNLVMDTAAGALTRIVFKNLNITSNGITEGTNQARVTFRNVFGSFLTDIVIDRLVLYESDIGISGNITTASFGVCIDSRVTCTTWTVDGTSTFDKGTIVATISAVGRTLTFNNSIVTGDVNCATLNINNTVITGTKIGTTATNVNNQAATEYDALGTFVPLMPFTTNGDYTNFVLSGDITINTSSIVFGKFRAVEIEQPAAQSHKIDLGPNITKVFGVDELNLGEYTLLPGKFMHYFASIRSGGTGNGIHLNVLEGQEVVQTPPTLITATIENATDDILDLVFSEAVNITILGWNIDTDGAALTISSVSSGDGTSTPKFQLSRSVLPAEILNLDYDSGVGDTEDLIGNPLASITDKAITNNVAASFSNLRSILLDDVGVFLRAAVTADFKFADGDGTNELPFSISFWFKAGTTGGTLFTINDPSLAERGVFVSISGSTGKMNWTMYDFASGNTNTILLNDNFDHRSEAVWHHHVITYDGSEANTGMIIYRNGVDVSAARGGAGTYGGLRVDANAVLNLGVTEVSSTPSNFGDGNLDEVAIYKNRELTSGEVTSLYNSGVPNDVTVAISTTGLVGYYRMENNADDSHTSGNDLTENGTPTYPLTVP